MSVLSGNTYLIALYHWDDQNSIWRMCEDIFREALAECSLTLPASGILRDGYVYQLPVSERHTKETDYLYTLLATPRAAMEQTRNSKPYIRDLTKPQNLENQVARLIGDNTNQLLEDGKQYLTDQHQNQLKITD